MRDIKKLTLNVEPDRINLLFTNLKGTGANELLKTFIKAPKNDISLIFFLRRI
jgi:hypothetical protein